MVCRIPQITTLEISFNGAWKQRKVNNIGFRASKIFGIILFLLQLLEMPI